MRTLIGDGRADVVAVGRSRGRRGLTRMFGAARWALHPDGRAMFVPAATHLADDLCPLTGHWSQEADGTAVRVRGGTAVERSATVAGVLTDARFTGRFELVDGDDVHLHLIDCAVTEDPAAVAAAGVATIGGVPAPVALTGTTSGVCGGQDFGPVAIELSILDAVGGAAQPLQVLLGPVDHLAVGGLLWLTGAPGLTAEDTGRFRLTVHDGRIEATVSVDTDAALGVSFAAPAVGAFDGGGIPAPGLAGLPVAARTARLVLDVGRDATSVRAAGTVHAHGRLPARAVDLDATIDAAGPLPTVIDGPGFEVLWNLPGAAP